MVLLAAWAQTGAELYGRADSLELLWDVPAKEQELLMNWLQHSASCSVFTFLAVLSKSDVLQGDTLEYIAQLACSEANPLGFSSTLCWSLPYR